ncbi:MAG: HAMP domain-containing protein, partial [Caldimicrobium sp.]
MPFLKLLHIKKWILVVTSIFCFLLLEYFLYKSDLIEVPNRSLFLFFLLQINVIILLLLLYMIFRYIWKIFWEIRGKRISQSLKLKLLLLYFFSIFFTAFFLVLGTFFVFKKSWEYWLEEFSSEKIVTLLLKEEDLIKDEEAELLQKAIKIKEDLTKVDSVRRRYLREFRYFLQLDTIEVYTYEGHLYKKTYSSEINTSLGIPPSILNEILKQKKPLTQIQPYKSKLLLRVYAPVETRSGTPYILAVGKLIDPERIKGLPKNEKDLLKTVNIFLVFTFLMVLFLVIFLGIWVGNKLGKSLSEPLQNLIHATQKLSQRDFNLSELLSTSSLEDEIHQLVKSFKYMAEEIKKYEETLKKYNE